MNTLLRSSACASILFGAVLLVGTVLVPWLGGPALFPDDLGELCSTLYHESARDDVLRLRSDAVRASLEAKRDVADEVILGHLSTAQAAERFRGIERDLYEGQEGGAAITGKSEALVVQDVAAWVASRVRP